MKEEPWKLWILIPITIFAFAYYLYNGAYSDLAWAILMILFFWWLEKFKKS